MPRHSPFFSSGGAWGWVGEVRRSFSVCSGGVLWLRCCLSGFCSGLGWRGGVLEAQGFSPTRGFSLGWFGAEHKSWYNAATDSPFPGPTPESTKAYKKPVAQCPNALPEDRLAIEADWPSCAETDTGCVKGFVSVRCAMSSLRFGDGSGF